MHYNFCEVKQSRSSSVRQVGLLDKCIILFVTVAGYVPGYTQLLIQRVSGFDADHTSYSSAEIKDVCGIILFQYPIYSHVLMVKYKGNF
jgi:hypothetical protein